MNVNLFLAPSVKGTDSSWFWETKGTIHQYIITFMYKTDGINLNKNSTIPQVFFPLKKTGTKFCVLYRRHENKIIISFEQPFHQHFYQPQNVMV